MHVHNFWLLRLRALHAGLGDEADGAQRRCAQVFGAGLLALALVLALVPFRALFAAGVFHAFTREWRREREPDPARRLYARLRERFAAAEAAPSCAALSAVAFALFDVAVLEFSRGIPLTSRTHANLQMAEVYRRTRERPVLFA